MKFSEFKKNLDSGIKTSLDSDLSSEKTKNLEVILNILNSINRSLILEDVLELVKELSEYNILYHTNDLHNSEKAEYNIKTEFEEMFLSKHSMNIKYIEIEKISR